MNVTFAGGGTGGHLYPAIAIADALVARGRTRAQPVRIEFLGARDRLEAQIVPAAGYELRSLPARPLARRGLRERLHTAAVNAAGIAVAWGLLARHKPDLVIASGGYVCFPVVVAARILRAIHVLRAPIALLEINAQPGLTNRLLTPLVDEVWGAFDEASPTFGGKYRFTGVPLRPSLRTLPSREVAAAHLRLDANKRTILAMGGSQGARSINDAVFALLARGLLPADWQVLHLTGESEYQRTRAAYDAQAVRAVHVRPYLQDPAEAYACADVAITRAGASTLGELAAAGLPAILIPYPSAADDHQKTNAQWFASAGAAVIIDDAGLSGDALWETLRGLIQAPALEQMRAAARSLAKPQAVEAVLQRIDVLTGAA